jgi:4-amino-4-deoxy-L-arabinose transferase-like glycosyltransferase
MGSRSCGRCSRFALLARPGRRRRSGPYLPYLVGLLLLGLSLRVLPLARDPLHQDEALYGFWGRLISSGRDPWLAGVPVDKPPLVPYLIAAAQALLGVDPFTLRLPALAASLLTIPLTYVLARRLYGDAMVARVAAAVMALTPYPVLFGAAAFTDALLVMWALAAGWAALGGRWGWAGLLLGLAFASKQQAILVAPLVVGLGWLHGSGRRARRKVGRGYGRGYPAPMAAALVRFGASLAAVVGAVFAWDALRVAQGAGAGFWSQGVESYGGLRLIWSSELGPRLTGWARLAALLFAWPWLGGLVLGSLGALLWWDVGRWRRTRAAAVDLFLFAFLTGYLFLHGLLAFPVWDRYLLPIVPVIGLLLGRGGVGVLAGVRAASVWLRGTIRRAGLTPGRLVFTLCALLVLSLFATGVAAAAGRIPVGGDHGAYDGLEQVVEFLRALPVGTVLYDRWLSWHYDYYLFDATVYRAGFASPAWLAADAAAFYDGEPRYLVMPSWESSARLGRALTAVGMALRPVLRTYRRDGSLSFVVYEIGDRGG